MASSSHLKPGEKSKINAKIDLQGKRGLVSKGISVYSNDPRRPVVTLSLKAVVN